MTDKVVCVMAIHQRVAMTLETIKMLQRQTYPIEIVLVGDGKVEQDIAKQTDCHYVQHANHPLGAKHQAGVDFARSLNPNVLMTTGSDSWISLDWVERMLPYLSVYDCVGQNRWHWLKLQRDNMRIVDPAHGRCQYYGQRAKEPLGIGRLITHKGLEMMDWQIYPLEKERGLDGRGYQRMLQGNLSIGIMNNLPIKILGIKGPWEVITPWREQWGGYYLPQPEQWLDEYFPGGVEALMRVRVACWPEGGALQKDSTLVLIEYIGPNEADMTWFGDVTGKRYKLGGIRQRGYVYPKDLASLLTTVDKQGKPVFRVVK